jgi:hypothetical protein
MKKTKEDQMSLAGTEEAEILSRLNERVERAVSLIQELRRERDSLKSRRRDGTRDDARGRERSVPEGTRRDSGSDRIDSFEFRGVGRNVGRPLRLPGTS